MKSGYNIDGRSELTDGNISMAERHDVRKGILSCRDAVINSYQTLI